MDTYKIPNYVQFYSYATSAGEYRWNAETQHNDYVYVNIEVNTLREEYWYDVAATETVTAHREYSYYYYKLNVENMDTWDEKVVSLYDMQTEQELFVPYLEHCKMSRRQFMARLMQYYISLRNSCSIFGLYHPWPLKPIPSYLSVRFGFMMPSSTGPYFQSISGYYGMDERYVLNSSGYGYCPPMWDLYHEGEKIGSNYTINAQGKYQQSYSSFLLVPGQYEIKVVLSGAGLNFSNGSSKSFVVQDGRGNSSITPYYSSGSTPYVYVDFEVGIDCLFYIPEVHKEILSSSNYWKKVGSGSIPSQKRVSLQTGLRLDKPYQSSNQDVAFRLDVVYKKVENGNPAAMSEEGAEVGRLNVRGGYGSGVSEFIAESSSSVGIYACGYNNPNYVAILGLEWNIKNAAEVSCTSVDHVVSGCMNYDIAPVAEDRVFSEEYQLEVSAGSSISYRLPYYLAKNKSQYPAGDSRYPSPHDPVHSGPAEYPPYDWWNESIQYNLGVAFRYIDDYERAPKQGIQELKNAAMFEPIRPTYQGGSTANLNKNAPTGCEYYWVAKENSSAWKTLPQSELISGGEGATVRMLTVDGTFSGNAFELKETTSLYYDYEWGLSNDYYTQLAQIQKYVTIPKYDGEVDWTGYEHHNIAALWNNNILVRPMAISY